MSQIEVCSCHTGEIVGTTRSGREFSVKFKDVGTCGVALVDEEIAEHLLGGIGHPEYYKAGAIEIPSEPSAPVGAQSNQGDPATNGEGPAAPNPAALTAESYEAITNYQTAKAAINKSEDANLLMELLASETQGKNRDGFVKLLEERLAALKG